MISLPYHRLLPLPPTAPPPISSAEIITGERLQAIADVAVITEQKAQFHESCPAMRLARFPPGLATSEAALTALNGARVVFVYSDMIDHFLGRVLPLLKQPIVLISHNGDATVDQRFRAPLDGPRIIHWFAQNAKMSHPKLTALPIGIANAQWPHGDTAALARVATRTRPRRSGLYVNFEIGTNPELREPLLDALRTKSFSVMGRRRPYPTYLAEMAQWRFCAAPPGNGIDCHRTWEALYLNVIPVVLSTAGGLLDHLPCIVVDDVAGVTLEQLEAARLRLVGPFAWEKLTLSYWRKRIRHIASETNNSPPLDS
jgi:hypothetical protein